MISAPSPNQEGVAGADSEEVWMSTEESAILVISTSLLGTLCSSSSRRHIFKLVRYCLHLVAQFVGVAVTPSMPAISASTIGRWLAAEQIHPWRYHSWQHIQKPEEFLPRARPVLQVYEQATS